MSAACGRVQVTTPEQQARRDEGCTIVEWEYPDGSGGWAYCEAEADPWDIAKTKHGAIVWIDDIALGEFL